MKKYGFIGTGNMGSALAKALSKKISAENIILNDYDMKKAQALGAELGCRAGSQEELVEFADCIFIGVKPQALATLFDSLAPVLAKESKRILLISMAAGTSIEKIETLAAGKYPVIRIMPNVACSVGDGMVLCASNSEVTADEMKEFRADMSESGLTEEIPEKLIDAASAVSGCGPAFVFMMAEALADGAVACGVPRDKAYSFAAQTIAGSGRLILETGTAPAVLKDAVCSPGGTTIEGVAALEDGGFRAAVMNAVRASYLKNFNL